MDYPQSLPLRAHRTSVEMLDVVFLDDKIDSDVSYLEVVAGEDGESKVKT